jgi:hypothetical protein
MSNHSPTPANPTVQRLLTLVNLYEQGQASELIDQTVEKLLAYEADKSRTQLAELQHDLATFEQQYGLPSTEFYQRYQSGQTDDRMDFVEWASLIQMVDTLHTRLRLLAAEGKA